MEQLQMSQGSTVVAAGSRTSWRQRRIPLAAVGCSLLAAGGTLYWYWAQGPEPSRATRPTARAAAPVSVSVATRQDRPIYLTGLGTVQASSNVAIHSGRRQTA